jgi:hypothetical protein
MTRACCSRSKNGEPFTAVSNVARSNCPCAVTTTPKTQKIATSTPANIKPGMAMIGPRSPAKASEPRASTAAMTAPIPFTLDMRAASEDKGAKGEQHSGDGGRRSAPGQPSHQQVGADERQHERPQHHGVVRRVRVAGQPVRRDRHQPRHQIGFRKCECVAMRVENVRVEQVGGVRDDGASDPRDVPDAEQAVFGVDTTAVAELECERVRQGDRGDDGQGSDQSRFTTTRDTSGEHAGFDSTRRASVRGRGRCYGAPTASTVMSKSNVELGGMMPTC